MSRRHERACYSLPDDLVRWAKRAAAEQNVAVSVVVAESIRHYKIEQLRALILEGLMENAEWHQQTARTLW